MMAPFIHLINFFLSLATTKEKYKDPCSYFDTFLSLNIYSGIARIFLVLSSLRCCIRGSFKATL